MSKKDDYLLYTVLGEVTNEQMEKTSKEVEKARQDDGFEGGVLDWLIQEKILTRERITRAKAIHFGAEFISLRMPDDVIAAVPANVARRYRVVPVEKYGSVIEVAMSDPSDLDTISTLNQLLKGQITVRVASEEDIDWAIDQYYPEKNRSREADEPRDSRKVNS